MIRSLLVFAVVFILWLLMTGSFAMQELAAGLLIALLVTLLSQDHMAIMDGLKLNPLSIIHMIRYLGYFLSSLVIANLDMARRVLSPSLPINPALVEIHTELTSDLGRMLLANSITLTPGTLTVDVTGDRLQVHWIDCPYDERDIEQITAEIGRGFESRIAGFLK